MHPTLQGLTLGVVAASIALSACTVKQSDVASMTGPSVLATSLTVTATPDSINQDGASQASIVVSAFGVNGQPLASLPVRVDMSVGGVLRDFGTLSARNLVTDSNGRATTVFTAPPSPPGSAGGTVNAVSIVATPVGSNALVSTNNGGIVVIRLVPPGVILPPSGTPTASFTVSPSPVSQNVSATFDASASVPGTNSSQIVSYSWTFGDGGTAVGLRPTHTFSGVGTFSVTLTVTNDRGVPGFTTVPVTVTASAAPTIGAIVVSPTSPQKGNITINFNADAAQAAAGHRIVQYSWNFGDNSVDQTQVGGSLSVVTHTFATVSAATTYTVVLTVLDDAGQKATTTVPFQVIP